MSINVNHWDRGVCHVSVCHWICASQFSGCMYHIFYSLSQFHSYSHSCNWGEREQAPTLMMSWLLVGLTTYVLLCMREITWLVLCHGASAEAEWRSNGEPERQRQNLRSHTLALGAYWAILKFVYPHHKTIFSCTDLNFSLTLTPQCHAFSLLILISQLLLASGSEPTLCVQREKFLSTPIAHASLRNSKYPKTRIPVRSNVFNECLDTRTSTPNVHASPRNSKTLWNGVSANIYLCHLQGEVYWHDCQGYPYWYRVFPLR